MRIKNTSRLDTKALATFIREVARREGYNEPGYLSHLTVEIYPGRSRFRGFHSGHATYAYRARLNDGTFIRSFGTRMWLGIPSADYLRPEDLAGTIRHEMAHNFGMKHGQMTEELRYGWAREWAKGWPLPEKVTKEKAAALPQARLAHAEKMLKRARSRAKLAAMIVKRWERRVRRLA